MPQTGRPFNPREDRLVCESRRLDALNDDCEAVRVEPIKSPPGRAPERYKVIFLVRGISGIDASQKPLFSERHEVEMYCDSEFPSNVPQLTWITPIWHPNIQHNPPKNVCVNKSEWLSSSGLDDLCQQMFEMVQYKNYHASNTPPYPLDSEAAKWVREYAEPLNIVNKRLGIYVDNRPFYKSNASSERALKIRIQPAGKSSDPSAMAGGVLKIRFAGDRERKAPTPVLQAAGQLLCTKCGAKLALDAQVCQNCGMVISGSPLRVKFVR